MPHEKTDRRTRQSSEHTQWLFCEQEHNDRPVVLTENVFLTTGFMQARPIQLIGSIVVATILGLNTVSLPEMVVVRTSTLYAAENDHQIHGTVALDAGVVQMRPENERLIIKFYYPEDGVEKDQTFRIFTSAQFPFDFSNGPDLDMSRRTKWPAYVVEVFTDLDGDVLSVSDNELFATTETPVEIGRQGVRLILRPTP